MIADIPLRRARDMSLGTPDVVSAEQPFVLPKNTLSRDVFPSGVAHHQTARGCLDVQERRIAADNLIALADFHRNFKDLNAPAASGSFLYGLAVRT